MLREQIEKALQKLSESDWLQIVNTLLPEMHEVDRNATQIWFRFFPLSLFEYLQQTDDREKAIQQFALQGQFELKNQISTSHKFLFGHRYWKETKAAIIEHSNNPEFENADLAVRARDIAKTVARAAKVDESLTVGITLVGLMTLRQVGADAFAFSSDEVFVEGKFSDKCAKDIVATRSKDDSQGLLGFLKTVDKKYTVTYDENSKEGSFPIIINEEIATASARDQSRNWKEMDSRCWEGVVPVECRSAACGTCWVGVLAGAEKLSDVAQLERKQMKVFGYNQPDDEKPFLRLACQAKAAGNVTITIPHWNGVFGKKIYGNVAEATLEPVTTSAQKLRETIATAAKNSGE